MSSKSTEVSKVNLILLGGPGAGKGTQAEKIVEEKGLVHVSTGDILRNEVNEDSELGNRAKKYMDRGDLVPDGLVIDMVKKRLKKKTGYLFDGFPRTINQAEELGDFIEIDKVVYIKISSEEAVRRLSARRVCSNCGKIYNLLFNKPRRSGICDECDGELYQRSDDKPEVIRNRFDTFIEESSPLIDYYRDRGILEEVDGEQEPDQVYQEVESAIFE